MLISNVPSFQHRIVLFLPMLVCMTMCTANIIIFHQPFNQHINNYCSCITRVCFQFKILIIIIFKIKKKSCYNYTKINYLLIFILSVKGTLLFALLASNWWPITLLRICTSLTFTTNKCSYGIAIFTGRWFTIRFHILFTFLTNSACISLSTK